MNRLFSILVLLLLFNVAISSLIITTEYGKIEGFPLFLTNENKANIFLGIPFASPPIDELRFEKPQPPQPWSETLQTKEFKKNCVPYVHHEIEPGYSEDCLYLNIFAPSKKSKDPGDRPVLVWIHGGRFASGGAAKYGYKMLAENFVSKGIVVVTIQYRLASFGFLSLDDTILPGNLGFWDQREVLLFLHKNIKHFGGNPNKITLWGRGAGASSVQALMISPETTDLFAQAIQTSNPVPVFEWTNENLTRTHSRKIATYVGCLMNDIKEIKACLKRKSTKDFHEAFELIAENTPPKFEQPLFYGPIVNQDFFHGIEDLDETKKRPNLIGLSNMDSYIQSKIFNQKIIKKNSFLEFVATDPSYVFDFIINPLDLPDSAFIPMEGFGHFKRNDFDFYKDELLEHHFHWHIFNALNSFFALLSQQPFMSLEDFEDMPWWIYMALKQGFHETMSAKAMYLLDVIPMANNNWPVYFFYLNNTNITIGQKIPYPGLIHATELAYLFGVYTFGKFKFNDNDLKLQKAIVDTISNFVYNGNPSTSTFSWTKINLANEWPYVNIDPNFEYRPNILDDLKLVLLNHKNKAEDIYNKADKDDIDEFETFKEVREVAEMEEEPLEPLTPSKIEEIYEKLAEYEEIAESKRAKQKVNDIEKAKKEAAEGVNQGHFRRSEDEF